ncbi:MAG: TonB-dependent receptor [Deltaproteobacteria bacterium]|nr:TonB-dependent receptor [Deltaproteobacteria bacterium]
MKRSYLVFLMIFLGIVPVFGGATWTFAQEDTEFTLEEITVTADKRAENLQKVSMSVSVLQGDELLNTGVTTITDILKNVPNVSTSDSGTGGGFSVNIRGLGNDMPVGMGESSVSINYDGAYDQRGESTLFGFFDVDRVEVLRGPQGTLYGRNASGGVMNVVSAKPRTDKIDGYASLEVADYSKRKVEAAVNVPMADKFAGRLAFVSVRQESTTKDDHGFRDPVSGLATRLQFGYMPSDEISVIFLYNYTQNEGQSWADIDKPLWDSGTYDVNRNTYPYHLTNRNKTKNTKMSVTAEFPLGPGILVAIPTYQTTKGDSSSYSLGRGAPGQPPPTTPSFNVNKSPYDYEAKTAEVRYTNEEDSDIIWTVGLYYTKTEDPVYPGSTRGASQEFESNAAFAQVTYPFTDTLRAIAGARYDDTSKSYYDAVGGRYLSESNSESWSYFDYKLGIEKDFSADMMGYFTLASGHKAGGFDDFGEAFDMESNTSGELGLKSRFLNNRLQVNGDIFYYMYDGYQVVDGFAEPDGAGGFIFYVDFTNADKAKSLGAEVETTALVGNATALTLNLAYLKNEYSDDFWVQGDTLNLKGSVMPHSPEFSVLFGIDHTFNFSNGSTLEPRVSYRWTDEQYAGFLIKPENLTGAYSIVDFSMSYNAVKNWSLNFYANNALNEHYYTMVQADGAVVFPGSPRIMGLTLNVRF